MIVSFSVSFLMPSICILRKTSWWKIKVTNIFSFNFYFGNWPFFFKTFQPKERSWNLLSTTSKPSKDCFLALEKDFFPWIKNIFRKLYEFQRKTSFQANFRQTRYFKRLRVYEFVQEEKYNPLRPQIWRCESQNWNNFPKYSFFRESICIIQLSKYQDILP